MAISTKAQQLLVERTLRNGQFKAAKKSMQDYKLSRISVNALIACGDLCIKGGQSSRNKFDCYEDAMHAYSMASAIWKLEELGALCMQYDKDDTEHKGVKLALEVYRAAQMSPKLTEVGSKALKCKEWQLAYQCFLEISDRKGLLRVAKESTDVDVVIAALTRAEAKEELIETGVRLLEKFYQLDEDQKTTNPIYSAKTAFEGACAPECLVLCGDAFLTLTTTRRSDAVGFLRTAITMYQTANSVLPIERLLAVVDFYLQPCKHEECEIACEILCNAGINPETALS